MLPQPNLTYTLLLCSRFFSFSSIISRARTQRSHPDTVHLLGRPMRFRGRPKLRRMPRRARTFPPSALGSRQAETPLRRPRRKKRRCVGEPRFIIVRRGPAASASGAQTGPPMRKHGRLSPPITNARAAVRARRRTGPSPRSPRCITPGTTRAKKNRESGEPAQHRRAGRRSSEQRAILIGS